jgi:dipeptidyl aminopeptidase/acylaminoacyl peptidase
MMKRIAYIVCLLSLTPTAAHAQTKPRPIEVDDLFRFERVADPQISPDGKHVVYVLTKVDLAGNKSSANLWLTFTADGTRRQLTSTPKSDRHPRWSPDGKHILFHSNRSGSNQLWVIDADGGEARQLTTLSTGAETGLWSRDGKRIAFVSAVYPEFSDKPFKESDKLNRQKIDEIAKSPVKAKVFTRLFYRHWDDYVEDKRQHLFVIPFDGDKAGEPRDVTPGDYDAYPTSTTFSIGDDFTFSPDGNYLLFTAVPKTNEAWSTNYDIWRVLVGGGQPENLTAGNPAADGTPQFSPDGKRVAYRAQKRPGFEADRWELMLADCDSGGAFRGKPRSVTANFDSWVEDFVWAPDGKGVYFTAEERGRAPVWHLNLESGSIYLAPGFSPEGSHAALSASRAGPTVAYTQATMRRPAEVFVTGAQGAPVNLSHANDKLLAELDMPRPESYLVPGAGGTPMQMWVLKPPGFDAQKRWPLVYLVHGGPQGAWQDGWSYRWNPEVWAARGYVVALPNPRGSTGFGQKYVDEISGDWGGKCYDDLMKGLEFLEKQPWIDKDRMAAAGASFGGYMMNWFQGNTTKFKTLITHCGVYNFESMYALTDELWFDEWEHGGPPWGKNRASYEKHSPHRLAAKFQTPMLIIHNDLDFRVPVAEGHQLFTTLQRRGVPSRFVNFPDEGHWVLRPQNSRYWNREVFDWLKKYVPPGGR